MSNTPAEVPSFGVALSGVSSQTEEFLPPGGEPVWADTPNLQVWGEWPARRLHTAASRLGRVAVFGDYIGSQSQLEGSLTQALSEQRPERLSELPGSHTAVLIDPSGSVTIIAGLAGQPATYFKESKNGVVIGSQPGIAARSDVTPDYGYAAAQLILPGAEGTLFGKNSSLLGVSKLLGGQVLQATPEGAQVDTYETFAPDSSTTLAEAAERLREALKSAVTLRLQLGLGVSADLSGGLDSSSIVSLATQMLEDGSALPIFTAHQPGMGEGDMKYVEYMLGTNRRIDSHRFIEPDLLHTYSFDEFSSMPWAEDLALSKNVSPNVWRYLKAYYDFIGQEGGGPIHLTGDGGDEVVGVSATYLADLIAVHQFSRFAKEGVSWARLQNTAPTEVWRRMYALGRTSPEELLGQTAKALRSPRGQNEWNWANMLTLWGPMGPGIEWLTGEARHALAARFEEQASQFKLADGQSIGDYIALNALRCAGQTSNMLNYYTSAGGSGVSPHSPFLDNEVIRAAFSVPAYRRGSPHDFKYILQEALRGIVPAAVLERRSKGAYDQGHSQVLRSSLPAFRSMLDSSRLVDAGVVDLDRVRATLETADTAPMFTMWALRRLMCAEGWHRGLESIGALTPERQRNNVTLRERSAQPANQRATEVSQLSNRKYTMPPYVHAIASEGGSLVLFNRRTDKYFVLDKTRSNFLRSLAISGDVDETVRTTAEKYRGVDSGLVRADVARFLDEATDTGILRAADKPTKRELPTARGNVRFVSEEAATAREATNSVRFRDKVLAAGVLAVGGVLLGRIVPRAKTPALRYIQDHWATRDATYEQAHRTLQAAQSLPYLGRLACMENAYTAALAAGIGRRKVAYHQGVSFDPLAFHAWVEAEGMPVRTNLDGQVTGAYQSFYD